jgi:hypothetical protein
MTENSIEMDLDSVLTELTDTRPSSTAGYHEASLIHDLIPKEYADMATYSRPEIEDTVPLEIQYSGFDLVI